MDVSFMTIHSLPDYCLKPQRETDRRQIVKFPPPAAIGRSILSQAQAGIDGCEWSCLELKALIVTAKNPLRNSAYLY